MKKLILLIVLAIVSSSCTKEDDYYSLDPVQQDVAQDSTAWNFTCDSLNINITELTHYKSTYLADNYNNVIGNMYYYQSDTIQFTVCNSYTDGVYRISGRIHNQTFVVINHKMNLCGGLQGLPVSYNLRVLR